MDWQLSVTLIGLMNVTRAVLPAMWKQRSGHLVTILNSAGLVGFEFCTACAASKFFDDQGSDLWTRRYCSSMSDSALQSAQQWNLGMDVYISTIEPALMRMHMEVPSSLEKPQ
jgi:hypothetical protein